ncbi:hypothetical protein LRR18_16375 [Mangrovimonas sp. AS39]|uniref:hypothetical protein n=1 Tax=Mangrovimonas futianensis TaxID=2895523 RepID=UPI001E3EAA91|nr:hypothetical protein [Mangrovimonas futianensis]MCF1193166.1 hypothetical protein [Mangrovimonas futianensis]
MAIEKLKARIEVLKAEHDKAISNLAASREQVAKAEAHMNMVIGHFNEANHLLQEFMKDVPPIEVTEVPAV